MTATHILTHIGESSGGIKIPTDQPDHFQRAFQHKKKCRRTSLNLCQRGGIGTSPIMHLTANVTIHFLRRRVAFLLSGERL